MFILQRILCVVFLILPSNVYAKNIHIVTTIKPLESLIANIIDHDDTVTSMVDNNHSPHNFSLKPSHIMKIHHSDAVILINPDFETFMRSSLKVIPEKSKLITLSQIPNLKLYPTQQYVSDDTLHTHNSTDYHIWLSPYNARKIIHALSQELSVINPEKKALYQQNAATAIQKLHTLDTELKKRLSVVKTPAFMVFHNAYQYFTKHYALTLVGTITDNPTVYSSVKRIKKAQKNLYDNKVKCVFKEPQFSSKTIQTVIADTQTKIGTLDPLGGRLTSGKNQYFQLMNTLTDGFLECLATEKKTDM